MTGRMSHSMRRNSNVLLTGATGIVGLELLKSLCKRGHRVTCLIRSRGALSPQRRLELLIGTVPANCQVVEGDITLEGCALTPANAARLVDDGIDIVVHSAASTNMSTLDSERIYLTNVVGTEHVVELARLLKVDSFVHMSTAYVQHGDANPYETSKKAAEEVVRRAKLNHTICRLAIVIGSSQDGRISAFSGYYAVAKAFHFASQRFADSVHRPVYVPIDLAQFGQRQLHLVQIDWVTDVLCKLIEKPGANETIIISHPASPLLRDVFDWTMSHFGMAPAGDLTTDANRAIYERIMGTPLKVLGTYILRESRFDCTLQRILGAEYSAPPLIDREMIVRALDYAVSVNFGTERPIVKSRPARHWGATS